MALNFDSGNREVVVSADASINNLAAFTHIVTVNCTGRAQDDAILTRLDSGTTMRQRMILDDTVGTVQIYVDRVTTNGFKNSDTGVLTTSGWIWLAFTFSEADDMQLYKATHTSPFAEVGYGGADSPGSGAATSVDGNLYIGNSDVSKTSRYFNGDIGVNMLFDIRMTLGELNQQWMWPHHQGDLAMYHQFGYNGLTTQPDLSGNGNSGAIQAALAPHTPMPAPFGWDPGITFPTAAAADVFFENRHSIGRGMKPLTAAGMGGVLVE